jgi:hypothetical protein
MKQIALEDSPTDEDKRREFACRALTLQLFVQALVLIILVASSCSTVIGPADSQVVIEHLPFLLEGHTTREEVIKHLGNPLNEYKQDVTISYVLVENSDGQLEVVRGLVAAKPPIYNLILSFGPDDILTRFSLLRVE